MTDIYIMDRYIGCADKPISESELRMTFNDGTYASASMCGSVDTVGCVSHANSALEIDIPAVKTYSPGDQCLRRGCASGNMR